MGFETVEEYLQANYGGGATVENYSDYLKHHFVVQEYTAKLQESFDFSDEEIEKYYDEHAEQYEQAGVTKEDVKMAQLRYIMILPADDSEESYNAIDTAFNEMLEDWELWEDKSEEGLAYKKYRDRGGLFLAEGPKVVEELLAAYPPAYVAATEEWLDPHPLSGVETEVVTPEELRTGAARPGTTCAEIPSPPSCWIR